MLVMAGNSTYTDEEPDVEAAEKPRMMGVAPDLFRARTAVAVPSRSVP